MQAELERQIAQAQTAMQQTTQRIDYQVDPLPQHLTKKGWGLFFIPHAYGSTTPSLMHCKILIIKLRALGDTVLLSASLLKLQQAIPNAQIHLLVPDVWAPVLEQFPGIQQIWKISGAWSSWFLKFKELFKLQALLKAEQFDTIINLRKFRHSISKNK
jgi:hypothetical protein